MQNFSDSKAIFAFAFAVAVGFSYGSILLSELGIVPPIHA